ncbi:MAG: hypothetical protein HYS57_00820 [Parcubacteria group bacterium]|nr:hypothetical protein [Parcubacteria group bacterium]
MLIITVWVGLVAFLLSLVVFWLGAFLARRFRWSFGPRPEGVPAAKKEVFTFVQAEEFEKRRGRQVTTEDARDLRILFNMFGVDVSVAATAEGVALSLKEEMTTREAATASDSQKIKELEARIAARCAVDVSTRIRAAELRDLAERWEGAKAQPSTQVPTPEQ